MSPSPQDNAKSIHARQMGLDALTDTWLPVNRNSAGGLEMNVSNPGTILTRSFDSVSHTFSGSNLVCATYQASGCTVMVVTLTYSGSNITKLQRV